jgi:hypothetical protein
MKQFLLTTMALFMSAGAFAEGAELSGKIEIEYIVEQAEAEADPVVLGNFNVDDAELAFKIAISDVVTTKWEVEAAKGDASLTEAWLDWDVAEMLTLTFGLFDQTLGPEIYADSAVGMDIALDFDIVAFNLEIGNEDDTLDSNSAALRIVPALTIAPDLGDDISLEIITGIAVVTNDPAELAFDIFLDLGVADFGLFAEFLATDLQDTAEGEAKVGLAYAIDIVEPYAELTMETVLSNAVINLEIGAGIDVAEGLSLTPYLGLENLQDTAAWEFGLVFVAKPKIKF